jgi:CRP-like cAMP-binding protein
MPVNPLLAAYLDESKRRQFVDSMAEVKVRFGEVIMRHGAHAQPAALGLCAYRTSKTASAAPRAGDKGNNYYIIKEGTCDVVVPPSAVGEQQVSRTITAGGSCGELALLTGQTRSATITVRPAAPQPRRQASLGRPALPRGRRHPRRR